MIIVSKMKKDGKKYLIRESELKEIIKEMFLMEVYDPNNHKSILQPGQSTKPINVSDTLKNLWGLISHIPGAVIPDRIKERVANGDSDVLQWLLGALGAQAPGTAGPDFVPNIGQSSGKGQNGDAHERLNVAAACNWLATHAYPRYDPEKCGNCATYVRMALNRGGLGLPNGMPAPSAKYYYNVLPANGWEFISAQEAGQPCDVVVVDQTMSLDRKHNYKDGHIAMCIGNGRWASDFLQNSAVGLAHQVPPEKIHFFRYKNKV